MMDPRGLPTDLFGRPLMSPEQIMSQAKFPGGMITPPATFRTSAPVKGPGFQERASNFLMPGPEGMQEAGLLTDSDIKNAQRQGFLGLGASLLADSGPKLAKDYVTTGQAIGRGIQAMQGTYKGAVDSSMQMRAGAQDFQTQKQAMEKAQKLPELRSAIIAKYPMPDSNDPQAMLPWLNKVIPQFIDISDDETVGHLERIYAPLASSQRQQQREPGQFMEIPGPDGKPRTVYMKASDVPTGGVPTYEKPTRDAGSQLLDEQRMFTRSNMLGDDYRATTKSIQQAADQYRTMISSQDAAKRGSPQAQIALVFSFMKTLDPGSVVRESEYATAKNAAGVPERVRNQYNKLLDGSFLSPEQVDGFVSQGASSARQWKRQQDLHRKTFDARANRWKIAPGDVTMDFFDGLPMGEEDKRPAGWHAPMALPGSVDPRLQGIPRKGQ
jgi:hypothetical protein